MTVTVAPAARQACTFVAAAASPPTTTQSRPSRRRKTGWVRIRPAMLSGLVLRVADDLQHLTGPDRRRLAETVHAPEALDAHAMLARDVRQRLPLAHAMRDDRRPRGDPGLRGHGSAHDAALARRGGGDARHALLGGELGEP